jgi:hypothetical protein
MGFRVSVGAKKSKGAVMVLGLGSSAGEPDNRHSCADQWMMVIEGIGAAIINGDLRRIGAADPNVTLHFHYISLSNVIGSSRMRFPVAL